MHGTGFPNFPVSQLAPSTRTTLPSSTRETVARRRLERGARWKCAGDGMTLGRVGPRFGRVVEKKLSLRRLCLPASSNSCDVKAKRWR